MLRIPGKRTIKKVFEKAGSRRRALRSKKLFEIGFEQAKIMAATGEGTDRCLEAGFLPVRVNFYSPIPDIGDLIKRDIWSKKSELKGIDFNVERQLTFLAELGREFGSECRWPKEKTEDDLKFYTHNGSFSFGCAAALHTMVRKFKPKRLIEVGSGNSSLVISSALRLNATDGYKCNYSIIDPYPDSKFQSNSNGLSELLSTKIELVPTSYFASLEDGDILFIDSGHVVKAGSDVNYLILEVLPRLKAGVIVHFHDINLPYEYPKVYMTSPTFRVFWNEAYLLQAFLAFNPEFEVLLSMYLIQMDHMDNFCSAFKYFKLNENWANSSSLWIRRKPTAN